MASGREIDEPTGVETTGHEWDGIKELNTPLPKWWLYIFYASIAVAVVMWILYPSFPYGTGYFRGLLGYDQRAELGRTLERARAAQAHHLERIAALEPAEILADPVLLTFALEGGRVAFGDNCAACHGQGGAGQAGGFPALVDDSWLWGGRIDEIHQTIAYGVRSGHPETRDSQMPAFADLLSRDEIRDVALFIKAWSEPEVLTPADAERAAAGEQAYLDNCAACHGEDGAGEQALGAPALNDSIWLYGGSIEQIEAQIRRPRHGVMPAFVDRLSAETIKMLAVYVHSLGGGVIDTAEPDG